MMKIYFTEPEETKDNESIEDVNPEALEMLSDNQGNDN